jgi:hypothetical protein
MLGLVLVVNPVSEQPLSSMSNYHFIKRPAEICNEGLFPLSVFACIGGFDSKDDCWRDYSPGTGLERRKLTEKTAP